MQAPYWLEDTQTMSEIGFSEYTNSTPVTPDHTPSLPTRPGRPAPVNRSIRSRKWFITVWDQEDLDKILRKKWKYIIVSALDHTAGEHDGAQEEHVHIFAQDHSNNPRLATKTAHWEIPEHINGCVDYCRSKGTPILESGTLGANTRDRQDWEGFVQACKHASRKELIEGPYSRLYAKHRGFAAEL